MSLWKPNTPARAAALLATLMVVLAAAVQANDAGWPRTANDGTNEIVIYQPQPDSLNGTTLQARVAVSVKRPGDAQPVFGALWISATLSTDRDRDIAEVRSLRILRTRFSDLSESDAKTLTGYLEGTVPSWDLSISLSRLRASLQPTTTTSDPGYRNDPPKILIENRPALLILLDGQPRLQDTDTKGFQVVANSALPVFFDVNAGAYWFYGSSVWFTTKDLLRDDWRPSDSAPSQLQAMVKDNNTLASAQVEGQQAASADDLRKAKIIVATEATELVVVQGTANYTPIALGNLLYVTNTESDLFLEVATQRNFLLLSGRWYAAPSLKGPWSFIPPSALPKSFADIPESSSKANVLAFVPGTDRAKDALMDNIIPQTAEVARKDAKLQVRYDGDPKFDNIPQTSLSYAVNTPSQIIRASGRYFACDNGVWYSASTPNGPWTVSDVRPAGIDNVPPSSPVYNTKFVYIYDSTPDSVYVGYLPGYRWSLPYQGVVVYGTGWQYSGWYGTTYYPRPATWGFAVRYNAWSGWSFGMSWSSGWWGVSSGWGGGWGGWSPAYPGFWPRYYAGGWFGPGGYRPIRPSQWVPPYRPNGFGPQPLRPGYGPHPWAGPGGNIYNRPGTNWVHTQPVSPGRLGPSPSMRPDLSRPNNIFADRDGNIHRNNPAGGWEQFQNRDWRPTQPGEPRRIPGPGIGAEARGWGVRDEGITRERGSILASPGGFGGGRFGRR